ncbi:hypothetical protein [Beijerinckia sp. L45]|uniref:hypothetical protein n=1 Tax=Beijerinckia sp. L45 TaxID=1641855 RepID=UPI00131C7360|nr:hypothetical protein [Beijerinckia sp. L45]
MRGLRRHGLSIRRGTMLLIAGLTIQHPAAPAARTMEQRMRAVCRSDIEMFCAGAAAEDLKACMTARRREVSAACMKLIDASE